MGKKCGGESVRLRAWPVEYCRRQCLIGNHVYEELLQVVIDDVAVGHIVMSIE
jgi:hypothetical protein